MSASLFLQLLLLALAGLLLRVLSARFEARHVLFALDLLSSRGTTPQEDHRETLVQRTGIALRAARLGRLLSIVLIAPPVVMLAEAGWEAVTGPIDSVWAQAFFILLIACLITMFFVFIASLFLSGIYDETRRARKPPRWLVDEDDPVPAPAAAGAILWDWAIRGAGLISQRLNLARPKAYLIEQDSELLMAIGEQELGAIGRHSAPQEAGDTRTERDMVVAIQRLDKTLVREVMRPLNAVTAISLSHFNIDRFLALARRTGYTRFPCYYDQVTNLIGFLNVHDFLNTPRNETDVRKMVHKALFIPEVARVDLALQEMLRTRSQIAICFDEFGGSSGVLSREDIIEEITGEIMDEYDRPERKLEKVRGHYLVDGGLDLDDLAEQIGLELEKRSADTLAGYIYQRLSRVPRRGETLDEDGWRLEVVQVDRHRIRRVRITPPGELRETQDNAES